MNLIGIAGTLAVLSAAAMAAAVSAVRWRDWKLFRLALLLAVPLVVGAGSTLWLGTRHPDTNIWGNAGLGREWVCRNLAKRAKFCTRDLPPALREPSARPN